MYIVYYVWHDDALPGRSWRASRVFGDFGSAAHYAVAKGDDFIALVVRGRNGAFFPIGYIGN